MNVIRIELIKETYSGTYKRWLEPKKQWDGTEQNRSLRTDRTWWVVCDRQRMRGTVKTTNAGFGWISLKVPIKVEDTGGETNVRQKLESSALGICVQTPFIQVGNAMSSWAYQNGTQQRSVTWEIGESSIFRVITKRVDVGTIWENMRRRSQRTLGIGDILGSRQTKEQRRILQEAKKKRKGNWKKMKPQKSFKEKWSIMSNTAEWVRKMKT